MNYLLPPAFLEMYIHPRTPTHTAAQLYQLSVLAHHAFLYLFSMLLFSFTGQGRAVDIKYGHFFAQ